MHTFFSLRQQPWYRSVARVPWQRNDDDHDEQRRRSSSRRSQGTPFYRGGTQGPPTSLLLSGENFPFRGFDTETRKMQAAATVMVRYQGT